jgi:hypothetical protein
MSVWNKLFNKPNNEYVYLREAFENHHHTATEDLNKNHPHATGILARYGVDLKKVRKRAATVVAAAAVAGLLLVRPHGVGAPVQDQQQTSHSQVASTMDDTEDRGGAKTHSATNKSASSSIDQNSDSGKDNDSKKDKGKGHRGHTRGRSNLAPPKRHGLHDLGLHKGDKNAPHTIKNVKAGKVQNGIVITDKYEDMNPS